MVFARAHDTSSPVGAHVSAAPPIRINAHKATISVMVLNTSDHPVQVTSHMPFWEINPRMHFHRDLTCGYHLDIPAGGAVRWEPGETKEVSVTLDPNASSRPFSYWNVNTNCWEVASGDFKVYVGASSRDIRLTGSLRVHSSRP